MDTNVQALKNLYEQLGGTPADVADITTNAEMIDAIAALDIGGGGGVTVDQTYNAESTNAQSGTAVAEAIAAVPTPTVDQSYSASSTNAQSGTAVAQALSGIPGFKLVASFTDPMNPMVTMEVDYYYGTSPGGTARYTGEIPAASIPEYDNSKFYFIITGMGRNYSMTKFTTGITVYDYVPGDASVGDTRGDLGFIFEITLNSDSD